MDKQKEVFNYDWIIQKSITVTSFLYSAKLVKQKIRKILHIFEGKINFPYGKFILDIASGVLITQSYNITEISRCFKEKITLKNTMKQLFNQQ